MKERVAQMRVTMSQVCYDDMTDSESSCTLVGQSKYSLSSALCSDSLQVELSLPDLLIQEPGEGGGDEGQEGTEERNQEGNEAGGQRDGESNFLESRSDFYFSSFRRQHEFVASQVADRS